MTTRSDAAATSSDTVARAFVQASSDCVFEALQWLLAIDIWLRALLPRHLDDRVGSKDRVVYQIRLCADWEPETWRDMEQVASLSIRDGRICKVDLARTGFMPDEER